MKTTIDMAREARAMIYNSPYDPKKLIDITFTPETVEDFVALIRADEQEKYKWDIHSCGPTCKRYACVAMREAVEAEREACAKVCENIYTNGDGAECWLENAAEKIRNRGNT
jgi:hypothetical protein